MIANLLIPLGAIIAAVAALGTLILDYLRIRHPLLPLERLGDLKQDLRSPEIETMASEYRDELVARWILSRRAPRCRFWLAGSTFFYIIGFLFFGILLSYVVFAGFNSGVEKNEFGLGLAAIGFWTIVPLAVGWLMSQFRAYIRNDWIRQELQWRGIKLTEPSAGFDVVELRHLALVQWVEKGWKKRP